MENILIAGYPKSGNTWLTRLVAELLDCPVAGFWGDSSSREIAIEGSGRVSKYRCYKTHQPYSMINKKCSEPVSHCVYVVRDPRDVVLSAADYYPKIRFQRFPALERNLRRIPRGLGLYRVAGHPVVHHAGYRIKRLGTAVLDGDSGIDENLEWSWSQHVQSYLASEVPVVRYEDLLDHPERECKRIMDAWGIPLDDSKIASAISAQSFAVKKKKFENHGLSKEAQFMRKARRGEWQRRLSKAQKNRFSTQLGSLLNSLGYPG